MICEVEVRFCHVDSLDLVGSKGVEFFLEEGRIEREGKDDCIGRPI